jgi:hypothetical protein
MIEMMAGQLLHLETEKLKAEHQEAELRIEMERRLAYQKDMDSKSQIQSLEKNYRVEKMRRESERRLRMSKQGSNGDLGLSGRSLHSSREAPRRMKRRGSGADSTGERSQRRLSASSKDSGHSKPSLLRDVSARSGASARSGSSNFSRASSRKILMDAAPSPKTSKTKEGR